MDPHYYHVNVAWQSDRKGVMCVPEVASYHPASPGCMEVATPPEFPKGMPGIWSPEHLFTAAVSSCLMTTFLAIAESSKLDFISFECSSEGKLEQGDHGLMMTEVILKPVVVIRVAADTERAMKVLEKSERNCLISNSVKAKILMVPVIQIAA